jgi:hypothetical protein
VLLRRLLHQLELIGVVTVHGPRRSVGPFLTV